MSASILEFNICGGGPMSLIKEIVSHSNKNVRYDVVSLNGFDCPSDEEYLKNLGVGHYDIHADGNKIIKRFRQRRSLVSLIDEHHYDCIHIHHDGASLLFLYGLTAKKAGVEKIVFHSHSTSVIGNMREVRIMLHKLCRPFLKYIGTDFLACSEPAGRWMYPNVAKDKIKIIKNGIDLDRFKINSETGKIYRDKLGYSSDDKVIGHAGRFSDEKNHKFIIDLFAELRKESNNYKLLLLGDGDLKAEIEDYAKEKGIFENIIFTGNVNNVQDYMQAMDLFILPSKFEGLPLTGIESQACGIPVIFSECVTKETKITDNVKFISTENMTEWIKSVKEMILLPKCNNTEVIRSVGYDIRQTAEELERIYLGN